MKIGLAIALMAAVGAQPAPPTSSDEAAKALGECLVMKTSGEDRLLTARWLLTALASAPQARDLVAIAPGKKDELDRQMAALFTRLIVKDCPDPSRVLFQRGSASGFEVAGEALGRVAMQEVLNNPQAGAALGTYTKYLNPKEFTSVLQEAPR